MEQGQRKDEGTSRKPNRLINEQSPYLRQHAYNPVDWYPWGVEALERAKAENKPILLSIGYSSCHWCHVMERESFENEEIAQLMNENFVCIKVDREERPDLDQIYMDAVQLFAGRGGWPLTMFLTPEAKPFFGGTYFPPEDRHGIAGFGRVLRSVAQAYRERKDEIAQNVERLTRALGEMANYQPAEGEFRRDFVELAARALAQHYDNVNGGIGNAPKFPNVFVFSLFLRALDESGDLLFAEMVRETLTKMAKGGICDQLGGGFHRYSVDDQWLVPHFEKMLYDNALLTGLYLDAGRALDHPEFLHTARRILDYVLREMTAPEGGFYSSQDADSEGHEGKFFVWELDEVERILGEKLAPIARRYFDISAEGNFEGKNILHRTIDVAEAAVLFKMPEATMAEAIEEIERKLFAARERRVKPARDEKILAAWNGMMIGAFAEGYRALAESRYLEAARRAADFVMSKLWDGHSIRRSYKDGVARFNGYLEDYAAVTNGLIDVYEASLEPRYLADARKLADVILERFLDRETGGFFFTSNDHERLITRSKAAFDGSTPSGNSEAIMALLRLHAYCGDDRYFIEAERALKLFCPVIEKQLFAFARMIAAVDFYLQGPKEIVMVGDRASAEFRLWAERLGLRYIPNRALFAIEPGAEPADVALPELVRGKSQIGGKLTAYLCHDHVCSPPQTTIEGLEAELRK
ncbi:MAG: thioredoxin domain-containing protein [Candidatus Binataceae bacterium]|jgi:uncharacterized protein YyaL (SSP411 family)